MKCCGDCFASEYIKPIIRSHAFSQGKCDFCGSTDVFLCDPRELIPQFRNLVDMYLPVSNAHRLYDVKFTTSLPIGSLHLRIIDDFNPVFRKIEAAEKLLQAIFQDEMEEYKQHFSEPVLLEYMCVETNFATVQNLSSTWERFVHEIKSANRFHLSNKVDLSIIKKLLANHEKSYKRGKIFYRSRISDKEGFSNLEMGNPPAILAKPGRANPVGISYLYLSEGVSTTLYETRATLYDYVSIGEFTLKEDIRVVNLRETHVYDTLYVAEEEGRLEHFMLHLPFLRLLERELSKPLRRSDNELDYLPTQYLSEFVKSLGYDGIEYKSSLNPNGYNIAAFIPEKFECKKAYVKEVHEISFQYRSTDDGKA